MHLTTEALYLLPSSAKFSSPKLPVLETVKIRLGKYILKASGKIGKSSPI